MRNSAATGQTADQLDSARREISQLKELNQTVSTRLDAAIGKLKTILD